MGEIKKKNYYFYSIYVIYLFVNTICKYTMFNPLNYPSNSPLYEKLNLLITNIVIISTVLIFFLEKKTLQEYIRYVFFLVLIFSMYFLIRQPKELLVVALIILASQNIDFDQFMKVDFISRIILFCFIILLHFSNILPPDELNIRNGMMRFSFGFQHANIFAAFCMSIIFSFSYNFRHKITKKNIIMFLILLSFTIYFINYLTSSRGTELSLVIFGLMLILYYALPRLYTNKLFRYLMILIPSLLLLVTIYLVTHYNGANEKYFLLNKLLTGRLEQISDVYNLYGFKYFGQLLTTIGNPDIAKLFGQKVYWIDNMYALVLLKQGIIFTALYTIFLTYSFFKVLKFDNFMLLIISVSLLFSGLVEAQLLNFYLIFPMLILGKLNKEKQGESL